ncbi:fungal-specific transcription factor domain-containing protein [Cantharellus anzutake]|uniref:fungal-specific transcription factor domain-containing protein n=1 Tax=Cantharellus anzutake TaxID=1750568 RepID=UPI001908DCA7|nr:fungal-specific transcription factor domain-containing protein [Cantharellus anzutake]KAF8342833.1 fungal-specific transcription factor domain-containing protein [Cantharellus anzutake]
MNGHSEVRTEENTAKRPRARLACDVCRKKKVRCDGADMPDRRCTGCVTHNIPCTYETHNKRRAGDQPGSLDERLSKMESILDRVQPRLPPTQERPHSSQEVSMAASSPGTVHSSSDTVVDELDESGIPELSRSLLQINLADPEDTIKLHYHGKSSGFRFMMQARFMKSEYTGIQQGTAWKNRRPEFWGSIDPPPFGNRDPRQANFPDDDLAALLTETFFHKCQLCCSIILEEKFQENWRSRAHLEDESIAALTLVVFAVASKFARNDPRVALDPSNYRHAGDEYYEEVRSFYSRIQNPISLTQFQGLALSSYFLYLSSYNHAAWTLLGVAVRLGQDVGAHRRKPTRSPSTVETELWKRTFWSLVLLDVNISAGLGRPVACQLEDMDAEMPTALTSHEEHHIVFFSCYLRLINILNMCLRVLYSLKKPKMIFDLLGDDYEQNVVAELDSSLNEWIDSIPETLRWNPHCEDDITVERSTLLYASYYNVQLLVHRPFIPQPNKPSRLAFPSLSICTNAARSCAHVLDAARRRGLRSMPITSFAAFSSALTLLIGTWGAKNSGVSLDYDMHVKDIDYCVKFLMSQEPGYRQAGKVVDMIKELASLGDLTLTNDADTPPSAVFPSFSPNQGKRNREGDDEFGITLSSPNQDHWRPADWSAERYTQPAIFFPYKPDLSSTCAGTTAPGANGAVAEFGILPHNTAALSQLSAFSGPPYPPWLNVQTETQYKVSPAPTNSYTVNYGAGGVSHTPNSKIAQITSPLSARPCHPTEAYQQLYNGGGNGIQPGQPYVCEPSRSSMGVAQKENPIEGLINQHPHASQLQPPPASGEGTLIEGDALGLWSFAPSGFEWDSWDNLIDTLKVRT